MGAWGYGVKDNDRFLDIYGDLMDEFNRCVPIEIAIINSMDRWLYGGMRISDAHNFFYASATAGWECGHFNPELHRMVKEAVKLESDAKSGYWSEVSQEEFKYRKKCLKEFLAKISVPNPNPKRLRSKPLTRYYVYGKGLYFKDRGELA